MTRRLRTTLQLAAYKVKHGVEHIPFTELEALARPLKKAPQSLVLHSSATTPRGMVVADKVSVLFILFVLVFIFANSVIL